MNGFKTGLLGMAAGAFLWPAAVLAQDAAHTLTTTSHFSLTIAQSAVIVVRSGGRGLPDVTARGNGGAPLENSGLSFSIRDDRGERIFSTLQSMQAALAESARHGARDVDLTLIF